MKDKYIGTIINGYLIVSKEDYTSKDGKKVYKAVCTKCGFEYTARIMSIKRATKNCNHIKIDSELKEYEKTHNVSRRLKTILYEMKARCYNTNDKAYRFYGDKGIRICDDWKNSQVKFFDWALNNGYEETLTIDRIDSSSDYSPDNCRWITAEENCRWKSTTNYITVNGICHSGRQWSEILGHGPNYVNTYIRNHGMNETLEMLKKLLKNFLKNLKK